jgi:hypothetical protein
MKIATLFLAVVVVALSAISIRKRVIVGKATKDNLKIENTVSTKPAKAIIAAPPRAELDALGFKFPELPRITCEQLKEMMYYSSKPPIIIDTRDHQLFSLGSLPTSINMPENPENEQKRMLISLTHDRPVVFYCGCKDDGDAAESANRTLELNIGFNPENILVLWKGWSRWQELGYLCIYSNMTLSNI